MHAEWGPEFAEAVGTMPEWFLVIQAARYLGVAPWDLVDQPPEWFEWAMMARNAEMVAQPRQKPPSSGGGRKPFQGLG